MGDDGKRRIGLGRSYAEDATGGGKFLTRKTSYDACLSEKSLNSRVAAGNGTRMTGSRPTATLTTSGLDGGYATTFADKTTGVEEQFIRI